MGAPAPLCGHSCVSESSTTNNACEPSQFDDNRGTADHVSRDRLELEERWSA